MPFVAQVAAGKREFVGVFGDDYPTADGTGVRDYIHVVDLACGHVKAVEKLAGEVGACGDVVAGEAAGMDVDAGGVESGGGLFVYNLGTGRGSSVLDVIHAYERACGREIPYVIQGRRAGDIAECWCDASKAREELGWTAERTLDEMCEDSWRWQVRNPGGYGK